MIPVIDEFLYNSVRAYLSELSGLRHFFLSPFCEGGDVLVPSNTKAQWVTIAYTEKGTFGISSKKMLFHNFFYMPMPDSELWSGTILGAELFENKLYFCDVYVSSKRHFYNEPLETRQQELLRLHKTHNFLLAKDIPTNYSRLFHASGLLSPD